MSQFDKPIDPYREPSLEMFRQMCVLKLEDLEPYYIKVANSMKYEVTSDPHIKRYDDGWHYLEYPIEFVDFDGQIQVVPFI